MLIYVFPPHYQLVCANSYTSSFSLISYDGTFILSHGYSRTITVVHFPLHDNNEEKYVHKSLYIVIIHCLR